MKPKELGIAILEGATNSEAKDVAIEIAEIAIDSFFEEGVAKEIPILKTVLACKKSWETFNDRIFLKKVASFMQSCPKFSNEEKEAFAIDADEHDSSSNSR